MRKAWLFEKSQMRGMESEQGLVSAYSSAAHRIANLSKVRSIVYSILAIYESLNCISRDIMSRAYRVEERDEEGAERNDPVLYVSFES